MKKISLGVTPREKRIGIETNPTPPAEINQTYYPSFYINEASQDLLKMAAEGEATIEYKIVSKTMNDRNSQKSCSMELEVHSITPKSTNGAMRDRKDESGEAVDEYFK